MESFGAAFPHIYMNASLKVIFKWHMTLIIIDTHIVSSGMVCVDAPIRSATVF